jgi:hypothetical protein
MTIQFPIRARLSIWALLALSCNAHATPETPMVGKPVERITRPGDVASYTVAPVVVADKSNVTTAPVMEFLLKPPETVRSALERWAAQADWIFGSQHYAVTVDFPVVATTEEIPADFKAAVRTLLDSTTLTDTPAQPCFYSNRVLRVVPRHELCARP